MTTDIVEILYYCYKNAIVQNRVTFNGVQSGK